MEVVKSLTENMDKAKRSINIEKGYEDVDVCVCARGL